MSLPSFPAEHLLQVRLTDWERELFRVKCLLFVAAIGCLLGLPWASSRMRASKKRLDTPANKARCHTPWCVGIVAIACWCVIAVTIIIRLSPYNVHYTRTVFQTPIMTQDECQRIIDMAFDAAQRNVAKLSARPVDDLNDDEVQILDEPAGWTKVRHEYFPTNDLNLVTDPFTTEDQHWLRQLADQRIAPVLSRVYGIPIRSIQATDLFVVRYDANTTRSRLVKHTDDGDVSFTIFLNNNFEGGGTQFWNRHTKEPFALLQSDEVGHLSTFPAQLQHEGYPISSGQRFILVGFLNVQRYDEDRTTPSGLSWWASWGSWNWAMVRIKEDAHSHSHSHAVDAKWTWMQLRRQVRRIIVRMEQWHDRWAVHQVLPNLVHADDVTEFLHVLDTHAVAATANNGNTNATSSLDRSSRARWQEDQQKRAFLSFLKAWQPKEEDDEEDETEKASNQDEL